MARRSLTILTSHNLPKIRQSKKLGGRLLVPLTAKGPRYWITALIILVLATTGSSYVYEELNLTSARSYFFQRLLEWGPRPAVPKFVSILLVEDDEYWKGELAGRRPIKREYLARLVEKLVSANAYAIALDFDTRLPDPDSAEIPEDYRTETLILIRAIEEAAQKGKKIILAAEISFDAQGHYQRDIDIYQANGLCKDDGNEVDWRKNITCGYIALPHDPLAIPSRLTMANGSDLDSFGLAVARATRPKVIEELLERKGRNVSYGSFISENKFKSFNAQLSTRTVLNGTVNLDTRAVIVGANWSRDAAGRGPRVDLHWTPVGSIVGAALHANFAEALLDTRAFSSAPEWFLRFLEIVLSLCAAITFAVVPSVRGKLISILPVLALLFFFQWLVLHGFGLFIDVFVPLVGLGLHAIYERLLASRE